MKVKNKKAEQAKKRNAHRERLKRGKEPNLNRGKANREKKPTILIVCEGKKTEPSYFKKFRLKTAKVEVVGKGRNPSLLIKQAKKMSENQKYDQVWCVFDKDSFPDNDFNGAIGKAKSYKFGVAYSNQAFEYWLLLHFIDHQGGNMSRKDHHPKLKQLLSPFNVDWDKDSKGVSEAMFDLMEGKDEKTGKIRRKQAIKRAKKIYKQCDEQNLAKAESSTTVFRLVEEICKYL